MKRTIELEFIRKIEIKLQNGFVTQQGQFIDKDLKELKGTQTFTRTVEQVDERFLYTREIRNPNEPVLKRMFRNEGTGLLQDQKMPPQPFEAGDNIQITTTFQNENVTIKIKLLNK